jgi:cytochrome c553
VLALLTLPACGGSGSAGADGGTRPRGLVLLDANGCLACHVYGDEGTQSLGAPDLTHQGERQRGARWIADYVRAPKETNPKAMMPPYPGIADDDLRELAAFLETSD